MKIDSKNNFRVFNAKRINLVKDICKTYEVDRLGCVEKANIMYFIQFPISATECNV